MLAKIKNNSVVTFPYGYDNLQSENPYTRFTGNIDLMELFPQTEEALVRGHELVRVTIADKPLLFSELQTPMLATTPTLEDGQWVLKWDLVLKEAQHELG